MVGSVSYVGVQANWRRITFGAGVRSEMTIRKTLLLYATNAIAMFMNAAFESMEIANATAFSD